LESLDNFFKSNNTFKIKNILMISYSIIIIYKNTKNVDDFSNFSRFYAKVPFPGGDLNRSPTVGDNTKD